MVLLLGTSQKGLSPMKTTHVYINPCLQLCEWRFCNFLFALLENVSTLVFQSLPSEIPGKGKWENRICFVLHSSLYIAKLSYWYWLSFTPPVFSLWQIFQFRTRSLHACNLHIFGWGKSRVHNNFLWLSRYRAMYLLSFCYCLSSYSW